jgi:non-heme chloroperoxidase
MYIEVEKDIRVFISDLNPGQGTRPVVFLHGWPANHRMFEYQYNVLPLYGFRCIGIDLRGFGMSDKPWHGYSYDRLADDLSAVLESLQLEEAALVGFSIGGAIAPSDTCPVMPDAGSGARIGGGGRSRLYETARLSVRPAGGTGE